MMAARLTEKQVQTLEKAYDLGGVTRALRYLKCKDDAPPKTITSLEARGYLRYDVLKSKYVITELGNHVLMERYAR